MSELWLELERFREQGTTNIRTYLSERSDEAWRLSELVEVTEVNQTTLQIFEASTSQSFVKRIAYSFGEDRLEIFIEEVDAIWNQEDHFGKRQNLEP